MLSAIRYSDHVRVLSDNTLKSMLYVYVYIEASVKYGKKRHMNMLYLYVYV